MWHWDNGYHVPLMDIELGGRSQELSSKRFEVRRYDLGYR